MFRVSLEYIQNTHNKEHLATMFPLWVSWLRSERNSQNKRLPARDATWYMTGDCRDFATAARPGRCVVHIDLSHFLTTTMATATHILDEQDDLLTEPQGPTQPAPTQTAPEHEEHNEPANPAVALLKGMFPDFDDAVLQSVLESVNWNQDAAIDVLLGMSDPSYVSTHHQVRHTVSAKGGLVT